MLQPNKSAIEASIDDLTGAPVSQFLTASLEAPSLSAKSSCDKPRRTRSDAMLLDILAPFKGTQIEYFFGNYSAIMDI